MQQMANKVPRWQDLSVWHGAIDSNAALHCGTDGPANRTQNCEAKTCDLACAGTSGQYFARLTG